MIQPNPAAWMAGTEGPAAASARTASLASGHSLVTVTVPRSRGAKPAETSICSITPGWPEVAMGRSGPGDADQRLGGVDPGHHGAAAGGDLSGEPGAAGDIQQPGTFADAQLVEDHVVRRAGIGLEQAGRVHDEVARIQQQWRDLLAAEARAAAGQRELPDGTDAAQLAFELGVILAGTDIVSVLHDDLHAISRGRTAIRARLTR